MSLITFKDYVKFYNENKKMLYMDEKETYPINKKNMEKWKNAIANTEIELCDKLIEKALDSENNENYSKVNEYIKGINCDKEDKKEIYNLFAEIFSNVIKNISFKEMLNKIKEICKEIEELIKKENYDYIYIYIDDEVEKSNTWVSLLFTGFLKTNLILLNKCFMISDNKIAFDKYNEDKSKKILILHVDDMSYSGTQINYSLNNNLLHKKLENNNLHYYLGIAYIGSTAKNLFKNHERNVKYFKNTEVINNFVEQVEEYIKNKKYINESEKNKYKLNAEIIINDICKKNNTFSSKSLQCYNTIIPIYFDHKIADGISSFQKILYFGSIPTTNKNNCNDIPLITGCENKVDKITFYGKKLSKNHCFNTIIDIEDNESCPETFYKRQNFIYKNLTSNVPRDVNIVEFLNKQIKLNSTNTNKTITKSKHVTENNIVNENNIITENNIVNENNIITENKINSSIRSKTKTRSKINPSNRSKTVTESKINPSTRSKTVTESKINPSTRSKTKTRSKINPSIRSKTKTRSKINPSIRSKTKTGSKINASTRSKKNKSIHIKINQPRKIN